MTEERKTETTTVEQTVLAGGKNFQEQTLRQSGKETNKYGHCWWEKPTGTSSTGGKRWQQQDITQSSHIFDHFLPDLSFTGHNKFTSQYQGW